MAGGESGTVLVRAMLKFACFADLKPYEEFFRRQKLLKAGIEVKNLKVHQS